MANNEIKLNTRLLLRYDSYENWMATKPVLLAGEVAVATIANKEGNTSLNHNSVNLPQVLIKVGDGTTTYDRLPFASALAADVYPWAKESQEKFETRVKDLVAGLNFAAAADLDALETLVGTLPEGETSVVGYIDNVKAIADAAAVKTEVETALADKVDKVNGYSLVSNTEIERLAGVNNYDDAWLGDHEAFKVESLEAPIETLTEAVANISNRAGKISTIAASYNNGGYELGPVMSATEGVANLNIKAKTEINAIDGRVGNVTDIANSYSNGYNLGPVASTTEAIANLNSKVKTDIDTRVGNVADIANSYYSGYNLGPVQSTTEAISSLNITAKTEIDKKADAEATTNALDGKVDKINGYSLVSDTEIARLAGVDNYNDAEVRGLIDDNAQAIEDLEKYVGTIPAGATATDIVAYVQEKTAGIATDAALEELTGRVTDLETESAKHAVKTEVEGALALKADKSALEATDRTLADVKTTVDNFFADDAAINDTIDTLKEIATYIATDKEGAADITARVGALEGKVDVDKVSEAIDADVTAAINAEVLRADGAYDARGAAADAQAAAIADAAGKYEEKGVAQGIVDALNLGETYEPKGAESRAIAAAETKVNALANGAVAENTAAIAAIKHADTGILAQAKKHTNDEIAKLSATDGALTLLDKRVKANEDKLAGVTGTVLEAINAAKAGIATTAAAGLVKASEAVTIAEDGALGIAKVSTDVLFNGEKEFVLFGGTANGFNN